MGCVLQINERMTLEKIEKMEVLEMEILFPEPQKKEDQILIEKAATLLNYPLAQKINSTKFLLRVLKNMEFYPFKTDQTKKYMEAQKERMSRLKMQKGLKISFWSFFLGIGIIISSLICLFTIPHVALPFIIYPIVTGVIIVGISMGLTHASQEWQQTNISEYLAPIPIPAINLAVQIVEKLPKANFFIYTFEHDSFLEARYGDEQYFLTAWKEPNFYAETF